MQNGLTFGVLFGTFDLLHKPVSENGFGLGLIAAAAAASIPEAALRGPMEALKNMQQVSRSDVFSFPRLGKATTAMLCREVPGNIVYLGTYTAMKDRAGRSSFEAGACAGVAYAISIYPIDSVRTQIATGAEIIRPTYRGVSTFALRIGSYGALMFCMNEYLHSRIGLQWASSSNTALETAQSTCGPLIEQALAV